MVTKKADHDMHKDKLETEVTVGFAKEKKSEHSKEISLEDLSIEHI
jgi:hypothetical protein